MLTKNLFFKDFKKKKNLTLKKFLKNLINSKNEVILSLTNNYNYSYSKQLVDKLKKYNDVRVLGMGGSALGANAIYDFLKIKIKKKFFFLSNLSKKKKISKKKIFKFNYLKIWKYSGNNIKCKYLFEKKS